MSPNYWPIPGVYMSTLRSVLFMASSIWPGVGPRAAVNTIPGPFYRSKHILCFCLSSPRFYLLTVLGIEYLASGRDLHRK